MSENLYRLLPAIYRSLDLTRGEPLRALLGVMDEQYDAIRANVGQLYEDWFVETCQAWVVPYLGELLGLRGLLDANALQPVQRALVGNTLAYRRRKGVATALQPLARDATGWYARAADARPRLATAQNVQAVDLRLGGSAQVKDGAAAAGAATPFDDLAHTPDFGALATGGALWNLPNVLLFLWRLAAYPLERVTPYALTSAPQGGLFEANPLGLDQPLFNLPLSPLPATRPARPEELPVHLTRALLGADLDAYRLRYESLPASARPANSLFYGPERALQVLAGGAAVPPSNVVAADLADWQRPPAAAAVLRSGVLDPFPTLLPPGRLDVTLGSDGPFTLTLDPLPASLAEAAGALQSALRAASPAPAFSGACVLALGSTLNVLPGLRGAAVVCGPSPGDAASVTLLKLEPGGATTVGAALSGALYPFPRLASGAQMTALLNGDGPGVVTLSPPPADVETLRGQLEAALRAADPESPSFTQATVALIGQQLLVLSGPPAQDNKTSVVFEATAFDPSTVLQLRLGAFVAVDPELGRIAFALSGSAPQAVQASTTTAFSGDVGGGPYWRDERLTDPATVAVTIDVGSGAGQTPLSTAIADWFGAGQPRALFRILDSATYQFLIATLSLPANGLLAIEAQEGQRPVLQLLTGFNVVSGTGQAAAFTLSGVVVDGTIGIGGGGSLEAQFVDCTLLPKRGPTYRFAPVAPMDVARSSHSATLLSNGDVLVAGGESGSASQPVTLSSAELYLPGERSFQATGSMATPRSLHTATAIEGKVIVVGGRNGSQAVGSAEAYDPQSGTFTTLPGTLSAPRWGHTATILGGSGLILILGGQNEQGLVSLVELLDPFTGAIASIAAPLDPPRILHTATALTATNEVIVVGGQTATGIATQPLVYDGDAQTLTPTVNQPFPAGYGQSATPLATPGFPVLLAGGQNLGGYLDQAWDYTPNPDPVRGAFAPTPGSLLQARAGQTATPLLSGPVLMAGGVAPSGVLATTEMFDTSTGFFTHGPSLAQPRVDHTATLLTSGDVLVAGGQGGEGALLASCELLEPAGPGFTSPYAIVGNSLATGARVSLRRCIGGGLVWPQQGRELRVEDCAIVAFGDASAPAVSGSDPTQPGPPLRAERVTFLGRVSAGSLLATDAIFAGGLALAPGADACLRFSYVPPQADGTFTPALQGYRCQPYYALAEAAAELGLASPDELPPEIRERILLVVRPQFSSTRYPDPGFLQLALACSRFIAEGGSNGAEMGLFNFLRQPQRVTLLRRLLADSLPLGRAAGLIYVT